MNVLFPACCICFRHLGQSPRRMLLAVYLGLFFSTFPRSVLTSPLPLTLIDTQFRRSPALCVNPFSTGTFCKSGPLWIRQIETLPFASAPVLSCRFSLPWSPFRCLCPAIGENVKTGLAPPRSILPFPCPASGASEHWQNRSGLKPCRQSSLSKNQGTPKSPLHRAANRPGQLRP